MLFDVISGYDGGYVVVLVPLHLAVDGFRHEGKPLFTIRDLDEYEDTAKVQRSQIVSPKVVVRQ